MTEPFGSETECTCEFQGQVRVYTTFLMRRQTISQMPGRPYPASSSSLVAKQSHRIFLSGLPCISSTSPNNLKASTLNVVMVRCRFSYFEVLLVLPLILDVAESVEIEVVAEADTGVGAGLVVIASPAAPNEVLLSITPSISILLEALSTLILFSLHILFTIPLQSLSTNPNSSPAVIIFGTRNIKHALARSNRHCRICSSESNDRCAG
jgi:hypothetical protein